MQNRRQTAGAPAPTQSTAPLQLTSNEPRDGMYRKEFNRDGTVRHSQHCSAMFNRRDWKCFRCLELLQGSLPRGSAMHDWVSRELLGETQRRFTW